MTANTMSTRELEVRLANLRRDLTGTAEQFNAFSRAYNSRFSVPAPHRGLQDAIGLLVCAETAKALGAWQRCADYFCAAVTTASDWRAEFEKFVREQVEHIKAEAEAKAQAELNRMNHELALARAGNAKPEPACTIEIERDPASGEALRYRKVPAVAAT